MDAVVLHGSLDQSLSPYKSHFRKIQHPLISRSPFDQYFPANGLVPAQLPYLYQSYPPQPPLLPLPATTLRRSATKKPSNGNRTRDSSLTPKKSKYAKKESPKKGNNIKTKPLGPDPKELPKDVAKVLSFISSSPKQEADVFSGSAAFAISPPPSSVPLPTFFLRPKVMSCKVEAVVAGIDTGATDDLRRLLRLR